MKFTIFEDFKTNICNSKNSVGQLKTEIHFPYKPHHFKNYAGPYKPFTSRMNRWPNICDHI